MPKPTPPVQIELKSMRSPSFTLWKWKRTDFKIPLRIKVSDAKVALYLVPSSIFDDQKELPDRQMFLNCNFSIEIENPSEGFIKGLANPESPDAKTAAEKIYGIYKEATEKIVFSSRWIAKLPNLFNDTPTSFSEIFYDTGVFARSGPRAYWRLKGEKKFTQFTLPRERTYGKINPIFKSTNLLTLTKWKKMNDRISKGIDVSEEINWLVKIKNEIEWGKKRIPTVEIAALIEVVIRNHIQETLKKRGVSRRKIKSINDEAGLSILLNSLLPLSLSRSKLNKLKKHIDALDRLRKVRNDIMHQNLREDDIDINTVKKGVESAIKITLELNE